MANGGIIGKVNNPTSTTATGVWQQEEQYEAKVTDTWPQRALFTTKSLRFDDGSSDYLTKTFSSAGNRKTWTWSGWVKRSSGLGSQQDFFAVSSGSSAFHILYFSGNDTITFNYNTTYVETNRKFRDVSAWYHVIFACDTTQSTASDRVKIYINGVQETSMAATGYPSQNADLGINNNVRHDISNQGAYYSNNSYFDGYMSEVIFIDGQALTPTSFGVTNSDGVWTPIPYAGTYGTNGFNLQFENAAALGTDSSPNGNTFTVNNLTSIDQSTDYPVVNYCTMNTLYPDGTITFSEGNLKLTEGNSWRSAGGTMAVSQGKWYWEISNVGNYAYIGFADIQLFSEGCSIRESFTTGAATTGRASSVLNSDGRYYQVTSGGAQTSDYPSAATFSTFTNSTIGIALNLDDNNFIFYKDGTAMNPSGNAISITAGTYIPAVSIYGNNVSCNFGSPPYAISSGNADGNGYGNFEYAVPSGYYALNTANLAEFG
jgi:hypothetical protein